MDASDPHTAREIPAGSNWVVEGAGAESARALGMTAPHHLGLVVTDVRSTMTALSAGLGCGPFHVIEVDHREDRPLVRGSDRGPYVTTVAFAWLGPLLLEVIEARGEGSPYDDVIARGGGFHHLAFAVEDVRAASDALLGQQMRMLADATGPERAVPVCYLEPVATHAHPLDGIVIELLEQNSDFEEFLRPIFETIGPRP